MTLVKINNIYELMPGLEDVCWAEFELFKPLPSTTEPLLLTELKQRFTFYAATNLEYQQRIKYPQFYAERVDSLTNPQEVGWAIAHALNLPLSIKSGLLLATESELIEQLNEIMKNPTSYILNYQIVSD